MKQKCDKMVINPLTNIEKNLRFWICGVRMDPKNATGVMTQTRFSVNNIIKIILRL